MGKIYHLEGLVLHCPSWSFLFDTHLFRVCHLLAFNNKKEERKQKQQAQMEREKSQLFTGNIPNDLCSMCTLTALLSQNAS